MESKFGFKGKLKAKKITAKENQWQTKSKLAVRRFFQGIGLGLPPKEVVNLYGTLKLKKVSDNNVLDYGIVSRKKVTDVFANFLVDCMHGGTSGIGNFKWHASGTSTGAESSTATALGTEVGTRDAGTQVEGASANIYQTVATHTYAAAGTITEHGIFSSSDSVILLDRSLFAGVAVSSGDQIQYTYSLTVQSSG